MQIVKSILIFAAAFEAASAVAIDNVPDVDMKLKYDADSLQARDESALEKRACTKNGCKCRVGTPAGQYCGLCNAVTNSGTGGLYGEHIFECNSAGGCCNYGYNTVCAGSNWSKNCPK